MKVEGEMTLMKVQLVNQRMTNIRGDILFEFVTSFNVKLTQQQPRDTKAKSAVRKEMNYDKWRLSLHVLSHDKERVS